MLLHLVAAGLAVVLARRLHPRQLEKAVGDGEEASLSQQLPQFGIPHLRRRVQRERVVARLEHRALQHSPGWAQQRRSWHASGARQHLLL